MKILETWWRIGEEVIARDKAGEPEADDIEAFVFFVVGELEVAASHGRVCVVESLN